MPIRQITLFTFRDGIIAAQQDRIAIQLQRLHIDTGLSEKGVVHQVFRKLMDPRAPDRVHMMQETTFPDWETRDLWRWHPAHAAIVEKLKECADWKSTVINSDTLEML